MRSSAVLTHPFMPRCDLLFDASSETLGVNLETFARLGCPPVMLAPIVKKAEENRMHSSSPPSVWSRPEMIEGLTGSVETDDPEEGHHIEVLGPENMLAKTAESLDYLMVDSPRHPQLIDLRIYLGAFFSQILFERFKIEKNFDLSTSQKGDECWYALMSLVTGRFLKRPSNDPSVSKSWVRFTTPSASDDFQGDQRDLIEESRRSFWRSLYIIGPDLMAVSIHAWHPKSSRDLARQTFFGEDSWKKDFYLGYNEFISEKMRKPPTASSPSGAIPLRRSRHPRRRRAPGRITPTT